MKRLKKKTEHFMDSVEAYSCTCVCVCFCTCGCVGTSNQTSLNASGKTKGNSTTSSKTGAVNIA